MTQSAPLDLGMLKFYQALSAESPPEAAGWPLDRQRAAWNEVCRKFRGAPPEGVTVETRALNGVSCQIFRPKGEDIRPGLIYFHGGGWVLGGPDTHGDMCAEMAKGAQCVVVLVDYRLAPENPHPAQLMDCLAVLSWLRAHGGEVGMDPHNICGGGDSAGGQLTAGLSLYLRDNGMVPLKAMLLIYPVLGASVDTPSYVRNAHAPCLTRDEMIYFLDAFMGGRDSQNWTDPLAAPLLASDLSHLPPAFVTVAAHDPLYDDGVEFHHRLIAAGGNSTLREESALAHSYMRARHVSDAAMNGFQTIVSALAQFTRT